MSSEIVITKRISVKRGHLDILYTAEAMGLTASALSYKYALSRLQSEINLAFERIIRNEQ